MKHLYQCLAFLVFAALGPLPAYGQSIEGMRWHSTFVANDNNSYNIDLIFVNGNMAYTYPMHSSAADGGYLTVSDRNYANGVLMVRGNWSRGGYGGTYGFSFTFDQYNRPVRFDGTYNFNGEPQARVWYGTPAY